MKLIICVVLANICLIQASILRRDWNFKLNRNSCPSGSKWVAGNSSKPCSPGRCVKCEEIPLTCPTLYCYENARLPVQCNPCKCPRCADAPEGPCESVCDPFPCVAGQSYVWLKPDRCICPVCRWITFQ